MRGNWAHGVLAAALALGVAPSVHADIVWTLGDCGAPPMDGVAEGQARTCSAIGSPINVSGTAWSDTSDVDGMDRLQSAVLASYADHGWGVINREESRSIPNIAMDNGTDESADDNSDVVGDSIFFVFDEAVSLTGVTAGYIYNDGDVTVLAYTGSGSPLLAGKQYAELLGAGGWDVVGSYDLAAALFQPIATGIASRYWMIAAYNPLFGTGAELGVGTGYRDVVIWDPDINCRMVGTYPNRQRACDGGYRTVSQLYDDRDYLKLLSLSGVVPEPPEPPGPPGPPLPPSGDPDPHSPIPEPGTLALMGVALGGLALRSRRART